MYLAVFIPFLTVALASGTAAHYGYNFNLIDGPNHWYQMDPAWWRCKPGRHGSLGSPINIVTDDVVYNPDLAVLLTGSSGSVSGVLVNNGLSPTFTLRDKAKKMRGVPYSGSDTFILEQFHFHFASGDFSGSEHKVNGKSYSGEIHFVFYNSKYGTFTDAVDKVDGLSVIGVFLTVANTDLNPAVDIFVKHLNLVTNKGSSIAFSINPFDLLPTSDKFYTYNGSLTTPGCNENVRWMVRKQPLVVTKNCLNLLRSLHSNGGQLVSEFGNDRPTQPLNGRIVESNF